MRELLDPLAQVGLDHLDAVRLQRGVQLDLLRDHRLALDDMVNPVAAAEVQHVALAAAASVGAVDVDAPRLGGLLQLGQHLVLPIDHVVLDRPQPGAQIGELGPAGHVGHRDMAMGDGCGVQPPGAGDWRHTPAKASPRFSRQERWKVRTLRPNCASASALR